MINVDMDNLPPAIEAQIAHLTNPVNRKMAALILLHVEENKRAGSADGTWDGRADVGRQDTSALRSRCAEAEAGEQRSALLRLVHEYERKGYEPGDIITLLLSLRIQNFDKSRPWTARDFRSLLHHPGEVIPDATPEESALLAAPIRPLRIDPEEDSFWASRPVLSHIRAWALARMAGPWAVLGECMAEAVCHTPSLFQTPNFVGGFGSLNMLIAITGRSGSGKNAAHHTAQSAFAWEGSPLIPAVLPRKQLGSGEGLVKMFGFNSKDDSGPHLERTAESVIVMSNEIDTYRAQSSRQGATLSPQLRQFYSGEALGFEYSDPTKNVVVPAHSYRGCFIAGVQPGRGDVILGDVDGGFAQRWLWLPAGNPFAPDVEPEDPDCWPWRVPGSAACLDGERVVMNMCSTVSTETRRIRRADIRGEAKDMEAHRNYTRIKVAGALALLDGRDYVDDEDWELSCVVMARSDRCRDEVAQHLRRGAVAEAGRRGAVEGVARAAALESAVDSRIRGNVMRILERNHGGRGKTSYNVVRKGIYIKDRDGLHAALRGMLDDGIIEAHKVQNRNGIEGVQYNIKRGR